MTAVQVPEQRLCEWCNEPLPADAWAVQRFCKPTHRTNAKRARNGTKAAQQQRRRQKRASETRLQQEAQRRERCEAKTPYATPQLAERVIRRRGGIGTTYPCGDHWHVTRRPLNAPRDWRDAYEPAASDEPRAAAQTQRQPRSPLPVLQVSP